jgi:hypothetical protein
MPTHEVYFAEYPRERAYFTIPGSTTKLDIHCFKAPPDQNYGVETLCEALESKILVHLEIDLHKFILCSKQHRDKFDHALQESPIQTLTLYCSILPSPGWGVGKARSKNDARHYMSTLPRNLKVLKVTSSPIPENLKAWCRSVPSALQLLEVSSSSLDFFRELAVRVQSFIHLDSLKLEYVGESELQTFISSAKAMVNNNHNLRILCVSYVSLSDIPGLITAGLQHETMKSMMFLLRPDDKESWTNDDYRRAFFMKLLNEFQFHKIIPNDIYIDNQTAPAKCEMLVARYHDRNIQSLLALLSPETFPRLRQRGRVLIPSLLRQLMDYTYTGTWYIHTRA